MGTTFLSSKKKTHGSTSTMSKIVQSGVFDPREYQKTDKEWARKRKSEYLGPGKIYYTREFVRDPRYEPEEEKKSSDDQQQAPQAVDIQQAPRQPKDIWPRKPKSDPAKVSYPPLFINSPLLWIGKS